MGNCQYIVPLDYTEESNETLIAKKTIRVIDCSGNLENTNLCSLWNYTRCTMDAKYCNPFIYGDVIKYQFTYDIKKTPFILIRVINTETGAEITTGVSIEEGTNENENNFSNIIIDTSDWTNKCFYIQVVSFNCRLNDEQIHAIDVCVADLMELGQTEAEALEACLASYCDNMKTYYSEPYCLALCEDTILIEGVYPNTDCDGLYYAPFTSTPTTNSYTTSIRVYGEIFSSQFDIEEVLVNAKKRKSTTKIETFTLMTKMIPYYVARKIANIFASQKIFVDGVEYSRSINLSKNNEEGTMWIIKTTLVQRCADVNFTCE